MAQAPQLNDSQLNLLAKIAANTGETQPKHGDGQHNLLFKIAQNTYASAVNGANIDISDVSGLQSALDGKVESVDPNYVLVKPTDNLAEKYSQIKNYTPSTPSSLLNGLLAFYKFNDVTDASGNGNTLTNDNGTVFQNGKIGSAAVFNGAQRLRANYQQLPASVSFWIKTESFAQFSNLFTVIDDVNNPIFLVQGVAGEDYFRFYSEGGVELASQTLIADNEWHHIVINAINGSVSIWVDGQLDSTASGNLGEYSSISQFGWGAYPHSADYLTGEIDAGGIWNRALTDSEISALYNAGHGIEHPFFRSATNRGTMFIVPGTYSLSSELAIDAEYVDIVGLGAQFQSPAVIVTNNTLNVTANDVRVSGISVGSQAFKIGNSKPLQVFENCVGGDNSFDAANVSGNFNSCVSGNTSFASNGDFLGKCVNCIAGEDCFCTISGSMEGGLFFCRLSVPSSSYPTPFGSGIIRFCLDGDNNIVNADAP